MTAPPADDSILFHIEEFIEGVIEEFLGPPFSTYPLDLAVSPDLFPPGPPQSDVPSSFPPGSRSRSFGQQSTTRSGDWLTVPPGVRHRRTRSDNTLLPLSAGLHLYEYDPFAVADDDAPSSELPPMGGPQPRRMNTLLGPARQSELPLSLDTALLAQWRAGPGSADASSIGSASPSLLSTDPGQTSAQWSIRHQGNALGHLSPLSPNPSPRRAGPGSDASSIRSESPPLSHSWCSDPTISPHAASGGSSSDAGGSPDPRNYDLQSDLHPPYPLDEEAALRGRPLRRDRRHRDHHFSLDSSTRILLEGLSIQDGTPAEGSHHTAGTSPYHHNSAAHSSGSLPEMLLWNGDGSSPPTEGSFGQSPISSSSYTNYFEAAFLNAPGADEGYSSRAGRSRSHSGAPGTVDADIRRRRPSPYPVAGPSTRQAEGSNAPSWSADGDPTDSFSNRGRPFNAQGPFAMDPSPAPAAGDPSNSSISWNVAQSSQGNNGHPPGYRALVASPATRRAANRRRKNKTKPGDHVCPHCQQDFTAAHNLRFHIHSHLSIKEHECGECGQHFGTPQVLKRHQRKCPSVKNEPVKP